MWSNISISGPPQLLLIDATLNAEGWEDVFFHRLFASLKKSGVQIPEDAPIRIHNPGELHSYLLNSSYNSLLLFAHANLEKMAKDLNLSSLWNSLRSGPAIPPFLLGLCTCMSFDAQVSEEALKSNPAIAPIAIVPLTPMTQRETGLFYLKFFTELKLHSTDEITGKMAWFSFSKAKELLRRRRYAGKFGIRC